MSLSTTQSGPSQNVTNTVLQQLLSGNQSQSTSGLTPAVLKAILKHTSAGAESTTDASASATQLPAEVTQALGELLSGGHASRSESNLATVQDYFKQHPADLSGLLSQLQGAGTYGANGKQGSSTEALLAALGHGGKGKGRSSAVLSALLASRSQDPLRAARGGGSGDTSGTGSTFSLLG
jgi:hypothetical protein